MKKKPGKPRHGGAKALHTPIKELAEALQLPAAERRKARNKIAKHWSCAAQGGERI